MRIGDGYARGMDLYNSRLLDGRFKLRHLRLILAVAENGTVAGAARELYVTQPVVTRGLREAEDIVGVELFIRGPRGVTPTDSGGLVIEHARMVLSTMLRLDERIGDMKSSGTRPVRVGTNMTGSHVLPLALVRLKKDNPAIKVTVFEGTDEDLINRLRRNDIDLLVGRLPEDEQGGVAGVNLFEESIEVFVRRSHPVVTADDVGISDLVTYPWVLPPPPTAIGDAVTAKLFANGHRPLSNLLESNSMQISLTYLRTTDAVAPLPASIGHTADDLVTLPIDLDTVPRRIGVSFLGAEMLSDSAKKLIQCLQQVASDLEVESSA